MLTCLALAASLGTGPPPAATALLGDLAAWEAHPADGVEMRLAPATAEDGTPALRLDYDFHGHGGWAAARRPLALTLPPHYELRFRLRGEGRPNNLEVKLVDPAGDNVWWHVRRGLAWPAAWTPMRIRQRQITFAWGPAGGGEPHQIGALELTVSAAEGGRGSVWFAGLELVPTEPPAASPGPLRAEASGAAAGHGAAAAVDGDAATSWRPAMVGGAELRVDLGGLRELGGLTLAWEEGRQPRRFSVELSRDGAAWTDRRDVAQGGAQRSELMLPDDEASFVRLRLPAEAGCAAGCGLAEVIVRPLSYGASANDFVGALAAESPRGSYPRGFTEEVYWTLVGVAGDPQESLVSEDGIVETGERGFGLEPFVWLGNRLYTWADVTSERMLAEGDLPIPTVTWRIGAATVAAHAPAGTAPAPAPLAHLEVTALATGAAGQSALLVRYRLVNDSLAPLRGRLVVAARPFQVNPPYQFLNLAGGISAIHGVACAAEALRVDAVELRMWPAPRACGARGFDEGPLRELLARGELPATAALTDATGLGSAVLAWDVDAAPGVAQEVVVGVPYPPAHTAALAAPSTQEAAVFAAAEREARQQWRAALDRVGLDLPAAAAPLVRSLRSNLAWILIHRDGPALQPGSRAYARSWIRDGALTGVALLRLRHLDEARQFAEWFAGYQYADGKVPCCVDRRGADPVPENDSHGELVHLIAEVYRYGGDRALAERLLPHVERAVDAIEALRQQRRTSEYQLGAKRAFFGLLPESISHEGYSAKPVHSYWDDTFAYRGLDDAVALAVALGRPALAATWARRRDQFRDDLLASLERVRGEHRLDYLPASADLADFDSTSTTTMLDPGGLLGYLPRPLVESTFERFWRQLVARRDSTAGWDGYTPYEVRHVGTFVRLGVGDPRWRERAHELLANYLRDQRPPQWNGWPEALHRDYRKINFVGDLPHGWVGSDFIRSLLDLFAFERPEDHALVLGAGVPAEWLERPQGIAVRELATPCGSLSYTLGRWQQGVRYAVAAGVTVPPGGLVLVPPTRAPGQSARIDGRPAPLGADGTVVVRRLPTTVDFVAPQREQPHGR
ncbi:MAG TPA: discoidin domain-containing protein [Thermoanaerobaculia bacterium]|nr:discoidin domain-containing protein [Thermoanaerobaculia bacterium]